MEQVLLSRKDLAKRWGFSDIKTIINYELNGIIKRVPNIPTPRYSIYEIEKIEALGESLNPLSPYERAKLERENRHLKQQIEELNNKLNKIKNI